MSLDGFYKVDFSAALPGVGGIVVVEGESVRGGDNQFLYSGKLVRPENGGLTATIEVQAYAPGAQSVFAGPARRFTLDVAGNEIGGGFQLSGSANLPGTPGITIRGSKIASLDLN